MGVEALARWRIDRQTFPPPSSGPRAVGHDTTPREGATCIWTGPPKVLRAKSLLRLDTRTPFRSFCGSRFPAAHPTPFQQGDFKKSAKGLKLKPATSGSVALSLPEPHEGLLLLYQAGKFFD